MPATWNRPLGRCDVLRFLLDEHISPAVAEQVRARRPEIPVWSLQAWESGAYLGAADDRLLASVREQGLTLVTYDRRTTTPLLRSWGDRNQAHGGVIFVNRAAISPSDIGGLVRALLRLWDSEGLSDWTNRVLDLQRPISDD